MTFADIMAMLSIARQVSELARDAAAANPDLTEQELAAIRSTALESDQRWDQAVAEQRERLRQGLR